MCNENRTKEEEEEKEKEEEIEVYDGHSNTKKNSLVASQFSGFHKQHHMFLIMIKSPQIWMFLKLMN